MTNTVNEVKTGTISVTELRSICEKGLLLLTITIPEMEICRCISELCRHRLMNSSTMLSEYKARSDIPTSEELLARLVVLLHDPLARDQRPTHILSKSPATGKPPPNPPELTETAGQPKAVTGKHPRPPPMQKSEETTRKSRNSPKTTGGSRRPKVQQTSGGPPMATPGTLRLVEGHANFMLGHVQAAALHSSSAIFGTSMT
ncbi:hypothetical protein Cgig2_011880 [Carnegiea gigantea]|uniref:Uncharacterized protein n=1 Tax=Carnegiea gigantea TaxID=171969 RepID=A0A9Q1K8M1_9CARY|nr:hypothetical protein Cgig2_011880 [Carnegiea gigantea]